MPEDEDVGDGIDEYVEEPATDWFDTPHDEPLQMPVTCSSEVFEVVVGVGRLVMVGVLVERMVCLVEKSAFGLCYI